MKEPKTLLPGQVWAKVKTNKRGVRRVENRTVLFALGDRIVYTRRVKEAKCLLPDWLRWAEDAHFARRVKVPCIVCNGKGDYQEGGTLSPFIKCDTCLGKGYLGTGSDWLLKLRREEEERHSLKAWVTMCKSLE